MDISSHGIDYTGKKGFPLHMPLHFREWQKVPLYSLPIFSDMIVVAEMKCELTAKISRECSPRQKYHCTLYSLDDDRLQPHIFFNMIRFMGPTWGPSGADRTWGGPHVGPVNFAIWVCLPLPIGWHPVTDVQTVLLCFVLVYIVCVLLINLRYLSIFFRVAPVVLGHS